MAKKLMIEGSCLCTAIQYQYKGHINELVICHCDQCKKAQGTAFAVNAPVQADLFMLIKGKSLLRSYYSSAKKKRVFCSSCGSPIFSAHADKPDILRLRVGTVTSGLKRQSDYQQYCDSKAQWLVMEQAIPAYPKAKN